MKDRWFYVTFAMVLCLCMGFLAGYGFDRLERRASGFRFQTKLNQCHELLTGQMFKR